VQREQIGLDLSNGQTHQRAQGSDQARQSHSDPSLAYHLLVEIHRGFVPALTARTPAFVDPMFRYREWWRLRHINDLARAGQTDATETQMAVRAREQPMLHDLGWRRAWPPTIMLGVTLFASLLLLFLRFFRVRFDEGRWGCFQLLQFLDALVSPHQLRGEGLIFGLHGAQLLLILAFPLQYLTKVLFQLCDLFFLCHGLSISDKGHSEQFQQQQAG
jgi:hypothetical protein